MRKDHLHDYLAFREGENYAERISRKEALPKGEIYSQAKEGRGSLWRRWGWRMEVVRRGLEARERLILGNWGLVRYHLGRMGVPQEWWADLEGAGLAGLLRALEKYDPGKAQFSTYASMWIRQAITREMGRLLPALGFTYEDRARLARIHKEGPKSEEEWALALASRPLSLDEELPLEDGGITLGDALESPLPTPEEVALGEW